MNRRRFMEAGIGSVGSALLGCREDTGDPSPLADATDGDGFVRDRPLRRIDALPNESANPEMFSGTLSASPADVVFTPGRVTPLLLYNHRCPGPLLEFREGQRVRIAVGNELAQDTTIHWHGLPVPAEQDGNPMDPIPPGAERVYEYTLPKGSAGTYWYHPHPHNVTAEQVASGLAGPLIVRADDDPLQHLSELCLLVSGIRLTPEGRVAPHTAQDWAIGRQNDVLLVNGDRVPRHEMTPGATERWRIINATAAHHFRLSLEGHTLTLVGTDGGLLGVPVTGLTEILLSPAQRIEVVVTIGRRPDARFRLRALRYQTDVLGIGTYADQDLMTIATTAEDPEPARPIPTTLRRIDDLGAATARQRVELSEVNDFCTRNGAKVAFLINGKIFDPNRVDLYSRVGRIELWDVVNLTGMAHPFHIHGTQFQLVSRSVGNVVTPAPYLAWIDTVLIPPRHSAIVKVRQDYPGKRMFHCHILEHEDNCMMAIVDVLP